MIPIVSIIVAAHTIEVSIKSCLQSLQNQSLQAIEVLIVNHAFTDDTVRLCEEFVKEDDRFRLIASDQPGLSEARNDGIKEAKGKYIAFVDGNDFV